MPADKAKNKMELQRGRPRAGAEIFSVYPFAANCCLLQRGRPRAGAEISVKVPDV